MGRTTEQQLLLGEWACLGILHKAPAHGFAIAARLKPEGDVGRVWSLSRALTYRSLDQLTNRGYIHAVGEQPGIAGGNRTILAPTRSGRAQLRKWLSTPVTHLRDLRSELLLKLIVADLCDIDIRAMLAEQHDHFDRLALAIADRVDSDTPVDVVDLWHVESSQAAVRFLERVVAGRRSVSSRASLPARASLVDQPPMPAGDDLGDRLGGHRLGEVEALSAPYAELFEARQLAGVLDALGRDLEARERSAIATIAATSAVSCGSVPSPSTNARSTFTASTGKRLR